MLQWRNWIVTKTKLFEFALFNGNYEIVDEVLEKALNLLYLLKGFREAFCLHCAVIFYLRPLLSLSLSLSLSLCKQFFMFNYCLWIFFFFHFFFIIFTKVYISLCANFSFSFDSLIWNTNGFVSIYEFCNFNSLIFIDFHSFLSPLSNVYVHKHGLQASSSKGNLLHSSSEKLEK